MWWWAGFYFAGRFLPVAQAGVAAGGAVALLIWYAAMAWSGCEPCWRRDPALASRGRQALLICVTGLIFCQYAINVRPQARETAARRRTANEEVSRSRAVHVLRMHVRGVLGGRGLSCTSRGFLSALILADRSALDPRLRERWRRLGIAHFLALSGLHLGIIVLPLYRLLALVRMRGALREAMVVMAVSLYAAVAQAPLSLLRALALLCVVRFNRLCGRRVPHDQALCVGAFIVCLFEPRAATDPGFVLSVAATAGVILIGLPATFILRDDRAGRTERLARWAAAGLCVSISAYLFTLPFSVSIFGRASFTGPPLSVLIAPLFTLLLYAGFIYVAGAYLLGGTASRALNLIVEAVAAIPSRLSSPGWPGLAGDDFNAPCYAAGLAVLALALARGAKRKRTALAGIIIIASSFVPPARSGRSIRPVAADTIAAGAVLIGREPLLIIEGPLHPSRAVHISGRLWHRGVRRVEWTVVLDAGCASRSGIEALADRCELKRILVSPWLLKCPQPARGMREERLEPVTQAMRLGTGDAVYIVQPPTAAPGSRATVPLAEASLIISPLDSSDR